MIMYEALHFVHRILAEQHFFTFNASVNSACAQPPPPPRADPRALAFFGPWMENSRGWGLLSCQISRGGDEKREQMPRSPSTTV